jgi:hypothetical protein
LKLSVLFSETIFLRSRANFVLVQSIAQRLHDIRELRSAIFIFSFALRRVVVRHASSRRYYHARIFCYLCARSSLFSFAEKFCYPKFELIKRGERKISSRERNFDDSERDE